MVEIKTVFEAHKTQLEMQIRLEERAQQEPNESTSDKFH